MDDEEQQPISVSAGEEEEDDDDFPQQQPTTSSTTKFSVDRSRIAQSSDATLAQLNVESYAEDEFKQGIITQLAGATTSNVDSSASTSTAATSGELLASILGKRPADPSLYTDDQSDDDDDDVDKEKPDDRDYADDRSDESSDDDYTEIPSTSKATAAISRKRSSQNGKGAHKYADDTNDSRFVERLRQKYSGRARQAMKHHVVSTTATNKDADTEGVACEDWLQEEVVADGLTVPAPLWTKLYGYQQTGVRWLWQLHSQGVGGILGDEMGLGKTIQVAVYLQALLHSQVPIRAFGRRQLGGVLLVCPTTLMRQWVGELHRWAPDCRVQVLHNSCNRATDRRRLIAKAARAERPGSILITSYSTLALCKEELHKHDWHYVILDEGHKIRNPDAQITTCVKKFGTPHRLILSGSPMQNNLRELWSLFDFVYPGLLGNSQVFMEEMGVPITQGGYANASPVQVRTAYKCACVLRDAIAPYLLRRMKAEVDQAIKLPAKNEQVLFCRITDEQRELYAQYLQSRQCQSILTGGMDAFVGLIILRKLCNHADLVTGGPNRLGEGDERRRPELAFGHPSRSGKMVVLQQLLDIWKRQGHRVLLFTQSAQMLRILAKFLEHSGHSYVEMSGKTSIGARQALVQRFNDDDELFVFALTTRVGGLGLNLIGADRVIIFDPDWNPSTDLQARERCWRIGQQKPVTIYRLLSSGTIEEKMYHRQIFKQFLTNRVLHDPKQKRFFKTNDLHELFTLGDDKVIQRQGTETAAIFAGNEVQVRPSDRASRQQQQHNGNYFDANDDAFVVRSGRHKKQQRQEEETDVVVLDEEDEDDVSLVPGLTDQRREQLRAMAKAMSQKLTKLGPSTAAQVAQAKSNRSRKSYGLLDKRTKVKGLVKQSAYKYAAEQADASALSNQERDDDFVLSSLLKKNGVHGAVQHDSIVSAGDADYKLVEMEAEKVAKQAANALRLAREQALGGSSKRPRFGAAAQSNLLQPDTAATPPLKPAAPREPDAHERIRQSLFGGGQVVQVSRSASSSQSLSSQRSDDGGPLNSSDLLKVISRRNMDETSVGSLSKYDTLAADVRAYLATQNGRVSSDVLVAKFKSLSNSDTGTFRAILRELCTFDKPNKQWVLRPSFA